MKGLNLSTNKNNKLSVSVNPLECEATFTSAAFRQQLEQSEYSKYHLFNDKLEELFERVDIVKATGQTTPILMEIGEQRDYAITMTVIDENMTVMLEVISASGGKQPSQQDIATLLIDNGIKRGVSEKQVQLLVKMVQQSQPGEIISHVVARGLPVKHGKDAELKPLVPNTLERILKPQVKGDEAVDLRDFGEILATKAGTPILRRLPPTKGRAGYDVYNTPLLPKTGKTITLPVGKGTSVCPENPDSLRADIDGMVKFKNKKMWMDETFVCKGVNVGTGNVKFDGCVVVNGDVAEKMKIICTGDVTVNGFVESATIEAGGDIIVTQGAVGKTDDNSDNSSCRLTAKGSVHIQHGQGLVIHCNHDVTVGKQLAYSRIECGGGVIVGRLEKPNGNLFSCDIRCQQTVKAGTIGAVSGSALTIDFSHGYNDIITGQTTIDNLHSSITNHIESHNDTMKVIDGKTVANELQQKVQQVKSAFNNEVRLYSFLQDKVAYLKEKKALFVNDIGIEAGNTLYPGVTVKLNNRSWRSDKQYSCAKIHYTGYQWQFDPLV